jgi:hypothetical protein
MTNASGNQLPINEISRTWGKGCDVKSSAHWFKKLLLVAYGLAIVWTSVAHAIEDRAAARHISPLSPVPLKVVFHVRGRSNVQAYVKRAAEAKGVSPRVAEWIVFHESRHRPEATGDGGKSRGLWQINKDWHPEVSDACAYNVPCSTAWSLDRIRAGHIDEWSTWKNCRPLFEDCPF